MDYIQAIWLALLQGLTEFLPISSSAHLILMPVLLKWPDQGLAFDVAVHIGTLLAVVLYYRKELLTMTSDWLGTVRGDPATVESRLAWFVIIGTIPAGLVGISMSEKVETVLRSPMVIAATTIIFGLLLWIVQYFAKEERNKEKINWKDALMVGIFQALSLIPGTSRSGITITAGLLLGLNRETSARFSFLLSVPLIALAGTVKAVDLIQSQESVMWSAMAIGVVVSAIVAYLTIGWFLRLLDRIGLMPFVVYRLLLGGVLLWIFLPPIGSFPLM